VSQHIAVLEADLGTPLLERRPVAPTEAGARLLEHAEPILLRLDAARADVARVAAGPPQRLRIGATPLAAGFAAALVAPALAVTVRVGARDEIARAVAVGELDTGLVDGVAAAGDPLRLPETGAFVTWFTEEPLAVAVPDDHPLSRPVALDALVDARWIDAPAICPPLAELAAIARADGFRAALTYDGGRRPRAAGAGHRRPRARAAAGARAGRRRGAPAGRLPARPPNRTSRVEITPPPFGVLTQSKRSSGNASLPVWPRLPNPSSVPPWDASPRDR
jgi:DNA-binding transcriptional LysR family regulator